ncbi:expressed unknown protein [Seminavis robusta]|uniref:Uncharacterized protein n=1 Tax=Seminavis robusta TaxID=568900 RepID=A0A9N8DA26_9STRA|nr:expressed unknown protein [Seminavis robusta]|eukprot:Sro59_g034360.1 n/a (638) ;mRNA; f:124837-126750
MGDSGWDDLFAMAEGSGDTAADSAYQQPADEPVVREKPRKSRKRRRKEKESKKSTQDRSKYYQEAFQGMLQSRIHESAAWPDWISLGGSLSSTQECTKFHASSSHESASDKGSLCSHCQQSASCHEITSSTKHPCLQTYCHLRNIRCIAKVAILSNTLTKSLPDTTTAMLQNQLSKLNRAFSSSQSSLIHNSHEVSLLESKKIQLDKSAKLVMSTRKENPFVDLVRLIIGCDDLYYRLYYLQITNQLTPMAAEPNTDSIPEDQYLFLPHPSEHHGSLTAAPSVESEACQDLLERLNKDDDETLLQHVGFPGSEEAKQHPLAAIQRYRFLETVVIFYQSGWCHWETTRQQVLRSLNNIKDDDEEHETPAPTILREWRDSCRDFLCHLYAYATLSATSLDTMARFAKEGGIVEYGAGTGYLATILAKNYNVRVNAFDVCPNSNNNETEKSGTHNDYHGLTPCCTKVKQGDVATLAKDLKQYTINARNVTLLLCYPPPKSSMALDTLKAFVQHGGTSFIHIGEFKGLTGSPEFEQYLHDKLECVQRFPCPSWGTDAAEVTMWTTKKTNDGSKKRPLLPCSFCKKREAVRRCRLLRYLVYCGKKCCKRDAEARGKQLRLHMIDLGPSIRLEFQDDRQFEVL